MSVLARKKEIDWAVAKSFEHLFPAYRREQIRMDAAGETRQNNVEIKKFSLKTPLGNGDIFVNTSLNVQPNKRCAVYGINGSGKTCLFEAISSGEIDGFSKHLHVHHMKELEHDAEKDKVSVIDTVLQSHDYRNAILFCIKNITEELAKEGISADRKKALEENLMLMEGQKRIVHGDTAEKTARGMLRVLGFDEAGEKQPCSALSGGLRMRVALACAFFINPDILLLDEPTNHLDLPSVLWLENQLRAYKGSFLLVTHDRTLLENVVSSVLLIQDKQLWEYDMPFTQFEVEREKRDKAQEEKAEEFLRRNRNLDANSPKYKVKMRHEAWMTARTERNILLQGKFTFQSPKALELPEGVLEQKDISLINIKQLTFSYRPEDLPFIFKEPIDFEIKIGTRVGIMGPNGAGKSTLLKLVTGKLQPTTGTIDVHPKFVTAYFGQHSTKELDMEKSAMEFMQWKFPKANKGVLRTHLNKTSVGDSISETCMSNLSFSQRSCVIFAALTFVPPHLLIMDEPTNFLDLDSVDSLIKAVRQFKGGLVVVTHNRDFLKRTVKTFLSIIPGAFLEFPTMKEAERATYSFISALESGGQIDVKNAIRDNQGGGREMSAKDVAARNSKLSAQQQKAKDLRDAKEAERLRLLKEAADKEAARKKKQAALKSDWKVGESCFAFHKGKWVPVEVTRVNAMGVSYKTATGATSMTEAKKLRVECPVVEKKEPAKGAASGGRGGRGARGRGGRGQTTGRGGRGGRGNSSSGRGRGRGRGRY